MLQAGDVVGRVRIERLVGRGAMATVYVVVVDATGERLALKVVDLAGTQPRERFEREAKVQGRIRHPNVVAVREVVQVGQLVGLLMEFVDGLPLDQLLTREPMDWGMVDRLFAQVCAGVAAAHAVGVVHRDLKPANVLVGNLGGLRVAKVADFGIVKVLCEGTADSTLTLVNATMGTPGYMAPEQAIDARGVDVRADIFSLGCVLYRMVCGRPAFVGSQRVLFAKPATGEYDDPRAVRPELPERYATAIHACLRPDREARPANVAALTALLELDAVPAAEEVPQGAAQVDLADLADLLGNVGPPFTAPPPPPNVRTVAPGRPREE